MGNADVQYIPCFDSDSFLLSNGFMYVNRPWQNIRVIRSLPHLQSITSDRQHHKVI